MAEDAITLSKTEELDMPGAATRAHLVKNLAVEALAP